MPDVKVNLEKCNGCATCVDTCPVGVFEIQNEKSIPVKKAECLVCRACEAQCPNAAIEVTE
ncbi:MAG: 4Fe-4S binding protein [Candidatus Bathyarchaeales archaeon]